uniref:Uncharacterized protein n=1 Tax=Denticeps clupeoides TaxID=299321 RepID=A0AAY4B1T3_9TELE
MAAAAADFRVEVRRKRAAAEQLSRYGAALAKLLDAQPGIGAGARETLRRELLSNFELAVQNNIVINGLSWEDAPEEDKPSEDERGILNDLLDEEIVQTTWKRRCYSKKILPHVVRALKSERKLMGLYEQAVRPEEMRTCPLQEGIKKNVSEAAPSVRRRAASLMKSLQVLQQRAEGLHQVLDTAARGGAAAGVQGRVRAPWRTGGRQERPANHEGRGGGRVPRGLCDRRQNAWHCFWLLSTPIKFPLIAMSVCMNMYMLGEL